MHYTLIFTAALLFLAATSAIGCLHLISAATQAEGCRGGCMQLVVTAVLLICALPCLPLTVGVMAIGGYTDYVLSHLLVLPLVGFCMLTLALGTLLVWARRRLPPPWHLLVIAIAMLCIGGQIVLFELPGAAASTVQALQQGSQADQGVVVAKGRGGGRSVTYYLVIDQRRYRVLDAGWHARVVQGEHITFRRDPAGTVAFPPEQPDLTISGVLLLIGAVPLIGTILGMSLLGCLDLIALARGKSFEPPHGLRRC